MSDLMTVLAQSYRANVLSSTPGSGKYVAVDPTLYQGTWSGKYSDNKSFSITISDVSDYRAKVRYQSDGTVKYQEVLIKDSSFRFGDTKFTLTGQQGQALIKNVVTDPATGSTYLDQAYATQSS